MKYITKYLPASGPLQFGDHFRYQGHDTILTVGEGPQRIPEMKVQTEKVELCVIDIQTDEVIGSISKQNRWLKENVSLTEEDLEMGGGYVLYFNESLDFWTKVKTEYCRFIKIRCNNCQHYH